MYSQYHIKTAWAMHYRLGNGVMETTDQYRTTSSWHQNSEIKEEYLSSSTLFHSARKLAIYHNSITTEKYACVWK